MGHVTYFWNFGTPSISRERFDIETSNLARKLSNRGTNYEREKKYVKGGREVVT